MPQSSDMHPQRESVRSGDKRYTILLICSITLLTVLLCKLYSNGSHLRMDHSPVLQLASRDGVLFLQDIQEAESNLGQEAREISPDLALFFFQPLPVNYASVELLQTINGIGPKRLKQFSTQLSFATRP